MAELSTQEKAIALFSYLKELSALKQKTITDIEEHRRVLYLKDLLCDDENISVCYRDRTETDDDDDDPVLVSVRKPEFKPCPEPDSSFREWLMPGWDDFRQKAEHRSEILVNKRTGRQELFEVSADRVDSYRAWLKTRSVWQGEQAVIASTRALFAFLYDIYTELKKESETLELVIADGFLMDREDPSIRHPLLTRRVALRFHALKNIITIEDVDVETQLYSILLQLLSGVDLQAVPDLNNQLHENDYHPLDRNETPDYLRAFVHSLSSDSVYCEGPVPQNWQDKNRFLMYSQPVFILRRRVDGTQGYLEHVIENITQTGWVPSPIAETVEDVTVQAPAGAGEETLQDQLAAVGGEDPDILLAKEANREQLEIARRIDLYNAVLVQGPPGTGKTHTIANLMGHFLAQGKSILVTSHTQKALQVLKDKLPENLQPLCVSLINDSNTDLERSVDRITEYLSKKTSHELQKEGEVIRTERLALIRQLGDTRKAIFDVISSEYSDIEWDGQTVTPAAAARFLYENKAQLAHIPGKVTPYAPLPLTASQLQELYRSNEDIAKEVEQELACGLPSPDDLMDPFMFAQSLQDAAVLHEKLEKLSCETGWKIRYGRGKETLIDRGEGTFSIPVCDRDALTDAVRFTESLGTLQDWMAYAANDGQKGGAYARRWETLLARIEETNACAEAMVEARFGKEITITDPEGLLRSQEQFEKLAELFSKKNGPGKLDLLFNKGLEQAMEMILFNGQKMATKEDADLALQMVNLSLLRQQCDLYWRDLLQKAGAPGFYTLDAEAPETAALQWTGAIRRYLNWFSGTYPALEAILQEAGIELSLLIESRQLGDPLTETQCLLTKVQELVPPVLRACTISRSLADIEDDLLALRNTLRKDRRCGSAVCCGLLDAIDDQDPEEYARLYASLAELYDKYYLQQSRMSYLQTLEETAPRWAEAIRSRSGVHGSCSLPFDAEEAWRYKQYAQILSDMSSVHLEDLMSESLNLSAEYRRLTGQYAEKLAWQHLVKKTETDLEMRRALTSWKLTVKKIGKGTGKNAPKYKAEARKLMAKCQNSVPAWIMPMNKVVESLDPRQNRFDVIIVDEASQSDVTALGILYLGKKMIIVGDDKQVSPLAIGTDAGRMSALEDMYLKGVVPSSHLYGAQTSLYDIAMTTYQPLMLREHFRCVPDIIGFSNMLSYDGSIRPLRDSGSTRLLPSVVNYRVEDGVRDGKRNLAEAVATAALIRACIDQPEYEGKTMGVISMLGDEQAKTVSDQLYRFLEPAQLDERKLICGNAAHFQGDERDVIFLSLVDSPSEKGALSLAGFGAGDSTKKRYNVAASRAKDQLWIVHSLDAAADLKPGDIRRTLLEYAADPAAGFGAVMQDDQTAFDLEELAAKALKDNGFEVLRSHSAGGYVLGLVVSCEGRHAAVLCDGDRRCSQAQIRLDMECQTILERAGWRFFRLRASDYYSDPKKAITKLATQLQNADIRPASSTISQEAPLLQRVLERAGDYLKEMQEEVSR
ncbi:MAG: AAA family ATPase [Firmicutes bacterium]|nr:AAA family ATPase [Bacillota bacterium]